MDCSDVLDELDQNVKPIPKKSKKIELKDIQNKTSKFSQKLPKIPIIAMNKTSLKLALKLMNCTFRDTLRINFNTFKKQVDMLKQAEIKLRA